MNYLIFIVSIICLSSCYSLPKTEIVVAFGSAADSGATAIKQVGSQSTSLSLMVDKEKNARSYMCGESEYLFVDAGNARPGIDPKRIAFRAQQLQALGAYGAALKEASDTTNIDKLADAANNLIVTVTSLGSAVAPGAGVVLAPLGNVVGKAVGLSAKDRYAKEVNAVIVATDPYVQDLISRLRADMELIKKANISSNNNLWNIRRSNLENMRVAEVQYKNPADSNQPLRFRCLNPEKFKSNQIVHITYKEDDRGAVHDRYMAMVDAQMASDATVVSTNQSLEVLSKIAATHHSLAEDSKKITSDVRDLLSATDSLVELVAAAKKGI